MAMKAERRKESPTHVATERVGRFLKGLKTQSTTSGIVFWLVVILVVALILGWRYYRQWEENAASKEWVLEGGATTLDDLEHVEKEYPNTVAGLMARFTEARLRLRLGLDKYASAEEKERNEARENLKKADELYAKLADEVLQYRALSGAQSAGPLLRQEALRGVAKARESQGLLDGAREYYQKLADSKPETQAVKDAREALQNLDKNAAKVKEFYDKLQELSSAKAPGTP
jgi:hypothetical protein